MSTPSSASFRLVQRVNTFPPPVHSQVTSQYYLEAAFGKVIMGLLTAGFNGCFRVFHLQDPTFSLKLFTPLGPGFHTLEHPHLSDCS